MKSLSLKKKKFLLGALIYGIILVVIVLITNLEPLNACLSYLLFILRPVLIGLTVAYLCNPFFRFFEHRLFYKIHPMGLRRAIALFFTYLTVLLIIGVLLLLIIPQLVQSISNFINERDAFLNTSLGEINNLIHDLNAMLPTGETGEGMIPLLEIEPIKQSINELLASIELDSGLLLSLISFQTIDTLVSFTGGLFSLVADIILGLFISFYLLSTKEKRYAQIMRLRRAFFSDATNAKITRVCETADRSFGGFLRGKILDSSLIGVLVYIAISIMDVPYAILIAAIVGITDIVPIVGPFIGVIPSAIIILLTDPGKVIPFLLCILIVQQIDGNIIAPKILGENTGVSSLCVMIAITTMGSLWGLVGMILGVPLFATVLELTSSYLDSRLQKKGLSTDTEDYYTPELAKQEETAGTIFARIQKRKELRLQAVTDGGQGSLNEYEHFRLKVYSAVKKHNMLTKNYETNFSEFSKEIAPLVSIAEEQIDELDPEISMQDIEEVLAAENKDDAIDALLDKKEEESEAQEMPTAEPETVTVSANLEESDSSTQLQ